MSLKIQNICQHNFVNKCLLSPTLLIIKTTWEISGTS
jgi:hypothetical protein